MVLQIHLSKEEYQVMDAYAKKHNVDLGVAMKNIFFEKIEDEYDYMIADKALKEYELNPKTYSLSSLINDLDE